MKQITVVGVGYVGLVTGTCLADLGNRVVCLDINEERIEGLKRGIMPIYEPGLEEMVRRNVKAGRLSFTTSYEEALREAEFVFIAVGTPEGVDGEADLRYVRMAARSIAEVMDHPMIIVNKSTVPVGTGDWVADIIRENQAKPIPFSVVSNPEFLREGSAINDFMYPDRIVLGSLDREAAEKVAQLYLPLRAPIMITDLRTAEMIKYASNAFLATRISFINEIANICEALGADVREVAVGMGYDKRIGHHFLDAGIGYGGSCFAGDTTIFALNGHRVVARPFEELVAGEGERVQAGAVEIVTPQRVSQVLAFDLTTGRATLADVRCFTRRWYEGPMVTLRARMGRRLRVTADHPVVLYDPSARGFRIVLAEQVRAGDRLVAATALPDLEQPAAVDLIEALAESPLETEVKVRPRDDAFNGTFVTLEVTDVEVEPSAEYVYSLETTTGTLLTASGLVAHNCFPKDVKALAYMATVHGQHPQLLHAVMEINQYQRRKVIFKLRELLGSLKNKVIGLLGLSFKPNTDDMREAPSLSIARMLLSEGAIVRAYDPVAMPNARKLLPDVQLADNPYEMAEGCDALVVVTDWNEFKQLDMERIRDLMRQPVLIDGRNIYDPARMRALGFRYRGIGRGYYTNAQEEAKVVEGALA